MRIKRFKAHNYRQHSDVEFEPEGNVIAIVGPNGAGKSNLVAGMRFGMEGAIPKANKDDLLQWGAKSGFTEIDIEQDNDLITVHRGLGGGKTWAKRNDEKPITAIKGVNRAMLGWLGYDKAIGDIVFVGQNELSDVLFADASVRKMSFNRMCGLGETVKIHRELLPLIQQHVPDNSDIDVRIETLTQHLAELQVAEQNAEREYQELKNQQVPESADALRRQAQDLDTFLSTLRDLGRSAERVRELRQQVDAAEQAVQTAQADKLSRYDIEQAENMLRDVNHRLQQASQVAQLHSAMVATKSQLDSVPAASVSQAEIDEWQQKVRQFDADISERRGNCNVLQGYINAMAQDDTTQDKCPLCHAEVDTAELRAALEASLTEIKEKIHLLESNRNGAEEQRNALSAKLRRESEALATAQNAYERAKAAYEAKAGDAESPEATAELQQRKDKLTALIAGIRQASGRLMQATSALQTAQGALQHEQQRLEQLRKLMGDIDEARISDINQAKVAEQAELRRRADKISADRARLDVLSNAMADATYKATSAKSQLDAMIQTRDTMGGAKQIMEVLTDVREWFHYEHGPAAVARRVLDGMNADVQTFLTQLDAPFVAEAVSSELTYQCMFTDGRIGPESGWTNVMDLSGGEKALLAVAFRLASYVTFAAKQGILVLDEPTANWDSVNVRNFCELLEKLRTLAKSLGLQIFVITHHHDCLASVDSYLKLTR